MAKRDKSTKGSPWRWALRNLIKAPATWIGAAVGVAVGTLFASVSGPVAGVCVGTIFGASAGAVVKIMEVSVRAAHANERAKASEAERKHLADREQTLLEKLKTVDLDDDVDVLAKLLEARDAIVKRCEGPDVDGKTGAPTLELVAKIANSAFHRAEELLDLTRRLNDPHLDAPTDAEATAKACRGDLIRAYQAVADSRSRILLFKEPSNDVFEGTNKPALGSLAEQLEEETAVLEGIDRRLRGLDMGSEISPEGSQDTSVTTYSSEMESES